MIPVTKQVKLAMLPSLRDVKFVVHSPEESSRVQNLLFSVSDVTWTKDMKSGLQQILHLDETLLYLCHNNMLSYCRQVDRKSFFRESNEDLVELIF